MKRIKETVEKCSLTSQWTLGLSLVILVLKILPAVVVLGPVVVPFWVIDRREEVVEILELGG